MADQYRPWPRIIIHEGTTPLVYLPNAQWVDLAKPRLTAVANVFDSRTDSPLRELSRKVLLDGADLAVFWIDNDVRPETLVELGMAISQKGTGRLIYGVDPQASTFNYLSTVQGFTIHTDFDALLTITALKCAELRANSNESGDLILE